jgi:sec-independent protein translocase protein TatC
MNAFQKSLVTYGAYFEELRRRLITLVKIFALIFAAGVLSIGPLIRLLIRYSKFVGVTVVATSPFQMLNLAMSVGFFLASVATIPLLIYYLYAFLRPALLPKERMFFLLSLPIGLGLFIGGFLYSSIMLYFSIKVIAVMNTSFGVANYWDVSSFLSQVIAASVFFGLVFEFPIVLTFMIRIGLLKVEYLRKNRKYAIALIFIFVGLLPPPDIFSTLIQAAPLVLLYEITLRLNMAFYLRRERTARILANARVAES